MKIIRVVLLFLLPLAFIACGTQKKLPAYYLENVTDTTGKDIVKIPELRIQKNDLLSIQVYSASTRPDVSDAIFNLPSGNSGGGSGQGGGTGGFLVDANGNIEYPRLGLIKAEGLTKLELAAVIKQKIDDLKVLINPSVIIRFLNFRVLVMGEVERQGEIVIAGERLTVLEAIGLAGGVSEFGKKNTIKIVRETNGTREIGMVDLTSKSLFESPYYNLVQNDIVMVEPTRQKARQTESSIVAQRITFALGLITSAAFIYNIFK